MLAWYKYFWAPGEPQCSSSSLQHEIGNWHVYTDTDTQRNKQQKKCKNMDVLWQYGQYSSFTEQLKYENERWRMYKCGEWWSEVEWKAGSKDLTLTNLQSLCGVCVCVCYSATKPWTKMDKRIKSIALVSAKWYFNQHIYHLNEYEFNRFRWRQLV